MLGIEISFSDLEFMSVRKIGYDPILKEKREDDYLLKKQLPIKIFKKYKKRK